MPVYIMIGIVSLLVALVLYSWGAWGAFRAKAVSRKHLTLLWVGVAFDVLATAMMSVAAYEADGVLIVNDLHTYLAFAGLGGMALAALVGTLGAARGNATLRDSVTKWVLAPWAIWVFVFVWGMLERGSKRMG